MPEEITADLLALLRDRVTSLESLTLLLLLRSTAPRRWSATALSHETSISAEPTHRALESLLGHDLIARLGGPEPLFHYAPEDNTDARTVDALARLFHDNRVGIITILNAYAVERMRHGAVRAFSDAFLLRKPKPDKDEDDG